MRFANFGHGDLLTLGAYGALTFTAFATAGAQFGPLSFGWQFLVAVVIAGLFAGGVAVLVDMLVYSRLRARNAHRLTMIFASFGVALILRNVILLLWGPDVHYYSRTLQIAVEILPNVRVMPDQIFVLGLAILLVLALLRAASRDADRDCHAGHGGEPDAGWHLRRRNHEDDPPCLVHQRRARRGGRHIPRSHRAASAGDGLQPTALRS